MQRFGGADGGGRRGGRGWAGPAQPSPGSAADLTPEADPASVARAIALRQLALTARTRAQLTDALARRGVPSAVSEPLLDRFEDVGLINDQEFARQWVSSRQVTRGLSRRALSHELRERGVSPEAVEEAVSQIDDESELEAARALVRRRLPATASDEPARRVRRLAAALARKGYGSSVALRAVREVLAESGVTDGVDEEGP